MGLVKAWGWRSGRWRTLWGSRSLARLLIRLHICRLLRGWLVLLALVVIALLVDIMRILLIGCGLSGLLVCRLLAVRLILSGKTLRRLLVVLRSGLLNRLWLLVVALRRLLLVLGCSGVGSSRINRRALRRHWRSLWRLRRYATGASILAGR